LRRFLRLLEREGLVERIRDPVSTEYQAAYLLKMYDGKKAVVLEKVFGYSMPVVGNLLCSRRSLYLALGVNGDLEAYTKLLDALRRPRPLDRAEPPHYRRVEDLRQLPILRCYEGEAGPYITASIVIARDLRRGVLNASIHRMLLLDSKHLAVRIVPRHLYRMYREAREMGEDLPVAVVIGAPPEVYVAAAASPPYGVFELEVANALMNGRLKAFPVGRGLLAPVESEIVILGRLLKETEAPEGPFTDLTGTLDVVRMQPVLEVEEILMREGALYYTILQGGAEHMLMMGFPREVAIWDSARRVVPRVGAVRLTRGGCGWLVAVLSIDKHTEGDAKNAILAAFAAHPSLKIAIAVDEDIDVDNPEDIMWAIATRMQPEEDLVILRGVRGSSLDPSADQETLTTSKLGIDATIPLSKPRQKFLRARIPWPRSELPSSGRSAE